MARIVVYHGSYGCETGCCGHYVDVEDGPDRFAFAHPDGESHLAFAKRLVEEKFGADHVADLVWDECEILEIDRC